MLGELGGGSGSVQVNFDLPDSQSCVLKVYLKVMHYITARNICVDQGYPQPSWSHLKDVDRFESRSPRIVVWIQIWACCLRHYLELNGDVSSTEALWHWYRRYAAEDSTLRRGLITSKKYIENLTDHVQCEAKESGVCHCRVTKNPTTTQKSLMAEVMNATSFCSTKWIGYCRTQAEKKLEESD